MSNRHGSWILLLAGVLGGFCRADTVFLIDGTEIDGTIVEQNGDNIVIKKENGKLQSVRKGNVEAIVREAKPVVKTPASAVAEAAPAAAKPADAKPAALTPIEKAAAELAAAEARGDDPAAADADGVVAEAKPKDGSEALPGAAPVLPKPGDDASIKTPADPKPGEETADAAAPDPKISGSAPAAAKTKPKPAAKSSDADSDEGSKNETAKKDDWTPPPGLPGFPDHAKRMKKDKEAEFMDALERMATVDEAQRTAAKNEIAAMGVEVLPYVVAGIQHTNVDARSSCMYLIGQLNGRSAVKHTIEVFYSAMPDTGEAASYQVPFIRAIKATLPSITGQSFIYVEADKSMVQDGLKKYVEWYEDNYDRLPPQLGEPKIEPTDPDYDKKLEKARALKLAKKSWPRPAMSADIVAGEGNRPQPKAADSTRPADQSYGESIPKVSREDALKRR